MFKRYILFIFDKLNLYITKLAAYLNNPFLCYLSILISIKRHNFYKKKKKKYFSLIQITRNIRPRKI